MWERFKIEVRMVCIVGGGKYSTEQHKEWCSRIYQKHNTSMAYVDMMLFSGGRKFEPNRGHLFSGFGNLYISKFCYTFWSVSRLVLHGSLAFDIPSARKYTMRKLVMTIITAILTIILWSTSSPHSQSSLYRIIIWSTSSPHSQSSL